MKTVIVVSGHFGTTLKAGRMLAEKLGGADIFNTLEGRAEDFDFSQYDTFVFGSNMRMFMLNGRFKKWARRLKKYYAAKRVFGYLIGCNPNNDKALAKMRKVLKTDRVVYAWGEYVLDAPKQAWADMYKQMAEKDQAAGKALPHIRREALDELAAVIEAR